MIKILIHLRQHIYIYRSTDFHCHMISVVVFFYSNKVKIMLLDYTVTEMGCFDDYLDAALSSKTMRGSGITTIILNTSQCITFHQLFFVTETLIAEALFK